MIGVQRESPGRSKPMGFALSSDQGKVALGRDELTRKSLAAQFLDRPHAARGGFLQVFLLFAWGGKGGTHTIAKVNILLLGRSARPSFF